jgi:A/G-specific adenine glycosylase
MVSNALKKRFVSALIRWNETENSRTMPWKGEKDPYKIWLSEVILQQTRVEQGWKYYERFINAYPRVADLARAPEQEVFKLWEGLGYYSRCRNLIYTAKFIDKELSGKFPNTYDSILALKGIGPYTAAAISSFAYDLPCAVLDGNVYRVLSRVFGEETPVDSTEGKKKFTTLANSLVIGTNPALYNQAIMDFGAVICKPVPECSSCFFNKHCTAYLEGRQNVLPVKEKKITVRERWFHYFIIRSGSSVLLRERNTKDIWQSLYEPLLIEEVKKCTRKKIMLQLEKEYGFDPGNFQISHAEINLTQKLTHQLIHFSFYNVLARKQKKIPGYLWIPINQLDAYPFPKTIRQVLSRTL